MTDGAGDGSGGRLDRRKKMPPQASSVGANQRLATEPPVLEQVVIKITHHSADTVTVKYNTIPGNHPKQNSNKVMLWEGTVIGWKSEPLYPQLVKNNDTNGDYTMENLELTSKEYIVGYSLTGEVMGICASAAVKGTVPKDELLLAPTSVTLTLRSLDKIQLVLDYATLRGYKPKSAGNWMGLWRGDIDPFEPPSLPVVICLPEDDVNEGRATFLTEFREHSTYTVGYFMADKENQTANKTAAALFRFDTAQFQRRGSTPMTVQPERSNDVKTHTRGNVHRSRPEPDHSGAETGNLGLHHR